MQRLVPFFAALCVLCGQASALTLTAPLDYQVTQRATRTGGKLLVAGTLAPDSRPMSIEARLTGDGTSGAWQPLAFKAGADAFRAELDAPAGGWYRLEVRALADGKTLGETNVAHVGIGEVFVIAGQSNSANHGEEKQPTKTGLVAAFDGKAWRLANDPQPGASGGGGSFLPPFGDALAERLKVPIGLVATGVGATSVREWLPAGTRFPHPPTLLGNVTQLPSGEWESKGRIYSNFVARAQSLGPRGFRAVLWHQGESDANQKDPTRTLPGALYAQLLGQLIRDSRRELGWNAPWFVAQVSYHVPGDEASPDIRAAQASLWQSGLALEGPDSDALKGDLRERGGQGVHFSGPGLRAHAAKWAENVVPWMDRHLTAPRLDEELKAPPIHLSLTNTIDSKTQFRVIRRRPDNNHWDDGRAFPRADGVEIVIALEGAQRWDGRKRAAAYGLLHAHTPSVEITLDWSRSKSQLKTHSVVFCFGNRLFWCGDYVYEVPDRGVETISKFFPRNK